MENIIYCTSDQFFRAAHTLTNFDYIWIILHQKWRHEMSFHTCQGYHSLWLLSPLDTTQGLCWLSGRTSYRKISWNLEAARLGVIMVVSPWHLTGVSAVLLPRCMTSWHIRGLNVSWIYFDTKWMRIEYTKMLICQGFFVSSNCWLSHCQAINDITISEVIAVFRFVSSVHACKHCETCMNLPCPGMPPLNIKRS